MYVCMSLCMYALVYAIPPLMVTLTTYLNATAEYGYHVGNFDCRVHDHLEASVCQNASQSTEPPGQQIREFRLCLMQVKVRSWVNVGHCTRGKFKHACEYGCRCV